MISNMRLNTEKLDYPYTNTKIRNCINNELIYQTTENLIIQEDYDKKHKMQSRRYGGGVTVLPRFNKVF